MRFSCSRFILEDKRVPRSRKTSLQKGTKTSMQIWPASLSAVELPQYTSCCWDRGAAQRRCCEPSELQDRASSGTHCPAGWWDWCAWWCCWGNLCWCSWAYWFEDWSCVSHQRHTKKYSKQLYSSKWHCLELEHYTRTAYRPIVNTILSKQRYRTVAAPGCEVRGAIHSCRGGGRGSGRESPSGVQGRSPSRGVGHEVPRSRSILPK